ncbi:MAG: hypothetical protein ACQ5SW_06520 [Sphaerochaetaceae bacterium]
MRTRTECGKSQVLLYLDLPHYCRVGFKKKRDTVNRERRFRHAVAQEVVVLLNTERQAVRTKVGEGWQPDVAQFLLDMFPNALEYGFDLKDIAPLVSEKAFSFSDEDYELLEDDFDLEDL